MVRLLQSEERVGYPIHFFLSWLGLSVKDKVSEAVEALRKELVEFTEELIRIPTANPPGENYDRCVELIASRLEEIGLEVKLIEVPEEKLREYGLSPPRICLLAYLRGSSKGSSLHFNGHYDVVPAGEGWTKNPFEPVIEGGKLYGRGSADMKGAIASMVAAVEALATADIDFSGEASLSMVPDEEIGGFNGTGYLVEQGLVKADAAVVGEPSGIDNLCIAHKGALWLEITTVGKAAHASMPHLGINAVEKMAKVVLELAKLSEKLRERKTKAPMPEDVKTPTIMVGGVISGGVKVNVVPERCSVTVDRRLIPEESLEEAEAEIVEVIERLRREDPELVVEVKPLLKASAAITSEDEEIVKSMIRAVEAATGKPPKKTGIAGFTDMRFLNTLMPTVIYGPGRMEMAHVADECVDIDDLVTAAKVYTLCAIDFLSR